MSAQASFALDLRHLTVALLAAPDGGIVLRLDDGHRAVDIALDGTERVEAALSQAVPLAERADQLVALLRVRAGSRRPFAAAPESQIEPGWHPSPNTGQPLT